MEKNSILVAEDDPELRGTLFEGLSKDGNRVHLAEPAEEALQLFGTKAFDLVIADVKFPGLNGLQLLESIITNGQRVPEDIELATKGRIASLVLDQIQWN